MSIIPNYVPHSMKTVNVMLVVRDTQKAIEFYNRAFGAEEVMHLRDPDGAIVHSEIKIADTIIMLSEENAAFNNLSPAALGGSGVIVQLYTPDVDAFFEEATKAGAEVIFPVKDQFYGDKAGRLKDPFGHQWIISTAKEQLTAQEMQHRFDALFSTTQDTSPQG